MLSGAAEAPSWQQAGTTVYDEPVDAAVRARYAEVCNLIEG